jgi:hypothetical protein
MAHVNLTTGKIYGCKRGSETYYHEVGHIKFEDKAKYGIQVRTMQSVSLRILLISIALYCIYPLWLLKLVILAGVLISIGSELYEEKWCWNYAKKKYGEIQKGKEI